MTKRRKPHKHNPARKYENPLLKSIEADGLRRWKAQHFAMMDAYADGSVQTDMVCILADTIVTPLMAVEGWTVEDDLDQIMRQAMSVLTDIAQDGFRWRASEVPMLKEALSVALDVTNAMPVREIANATLQARQVRAMSERSAGSLQQPDKTAV